MKRQDFRFTHRLCVRWAEVDLQKIVYCSHYLMYLDNAVSDYWCALGLPFESAMSQLGGDIYLKKTSLEYHASARWEDRLDVMLRCEQMGHSSIRFVGAVFRADALLMSSELLYVFADPVSQTALPLPPALRTLVQDFEAGQTVVRAQLGNWAELGAQAGPLREEVFVKEQGIALALEWDHDDHSALHAVLSNRLGQVIATGRLLQPAPGVARIGRLAVHRVLRGRRWGSALLQALLQAARDRGDREVVLHAQCNAEVFYQRQGFVRRGTVFDEAGIAHVEMVLPLRAT